MFLAFKNQFKSQLGSSLQIYIGIYIWRIRSKSGGASKSKSLSGCKALSGSRGMSLRDSRKEYGSVINLSKNTFGKLIFFNKSEVAASTRAGHRIWIDELFQRYLSDFYYSSKWVG